MGVGQAQQSRAALAAIEALERAVPMDSNTLVLQVVGADPTLIHANAMRAELGLELLRGWQVGSATMADHRLLRSGSRTLELRAVTGQALTDNFVASVMRADDERFEVGQRIERIGFFVDIVQVDDEGQPTVVKFEFPDELEELELHLLIWKDQSLRRLEFPRVGQHVEIAHEVGLAGF